MRHMTSNKKKGFTLVELLAVVVVLGIIMMISIPAVTRWIDRSKTESKDSQKNTLVMAAQSYAQQNSKILPKAVGQTKVITAEELKENNYLKEELQDADKNSCMASYVKIYKYDKNKYTYTPYLYCEGEEIPKAIESTKPKISVSFYSKNKKDDQIQDVSVSSFKATILGGSKGSKTFGIDGYSYSIGVRYSSDINEKVVEIYNSGSLNGGGKESLIIEKDLSDYTDITTVNEFIVTVEAYNRDGGHDKVIASSIYRDTTPPVCGTISGQAPSDEARDWLRTKGDTRTISVLCSDGDGSGCVRDEFTKTFDTEMAGGIITISDNAGNTTDCKVRVNIDWTFPTITVSPFHRTSGGGKGDSAGANVTATDSTLNHTITLRTYSNSHNGWLNRANYPYGVYYEITVDDNINSYIGQWSYNSIGIYNANASNILSYTNANPHKFTPTNKTANVSLSGQGMRRALYTISDRAGNKTEVFIIADIDVTNPEVTLTPSHQGYTDGVTVTVGCIDNESKCASGTGTHTGLKKSTPYTVTDNAGNSGSKTLTVTAVRQSNTCTAYNSCADSSCGCAEAATCTCYTTVTCLKCCPFAGEGQPYNTTKSYCSTGLVCGTTKCSSGYSCTSESACGCATWSSCPHRACGCKTWGGWKNTSSCSEAADLRQCRTLYY